MRIARFPHPSPLPGRSYWAVWEGAQPLAVFHFGDGNLIVEQLLGPAELACLFDWLREVLSALEWPTITLAMTLQASVFGVSQAPVANVAEPASNAALKGNEEKSHFPSVRRKPKRRKPSRPSLDRFIKKGLTRGRRRQ